MTRRQMLRSCTPAIALAAAFPALLLKPDLAAANGRIPAETGFCSTDMWAGEYERRWGILGVHSTDQINKIIHAKNGIYDDSEGVFAWIIHYWLRAWAQMAKITGEEKYVQSGISLIRYMFDHTDERRIRRGEIVENYLREPLGLQGTGQGGPFWKRWEEVNALNTGQVSHGIMRFLDMILENRDKWPAYAILAENYLDQVKTAVDSFNADWKNFGEAGSYYYRDSGGTNVLGETETAFNQSATMCSAHLLIDKWDSDQSRRDKAARIARYWTDHFADFRSDGTVVWPYMIHPELGVTEDTGHASVDLDFLVLAHMRGISEISTKHIAALVRTFKQNIWKPDGSLHQYVDGTTRSSFSEHYNAGFGWFELSQFDDEIALQALKTYKRFYHSSAPAGQIWARPMLGWANLLGKFTGC